MHRKIWLIATAGILLGTWLAFTQKEAPERKEIIKFSHKTHAVDYEISCQECHVRADTSRFAGDNLLPTMTDCAMCHDVESEDNCERCHFEDEETWLPFENPKREILFNHQFHMSREGATCETCHKNLTEVTLANAESLPDMQDCAACHNNEVATLECTSCHTNDLALRPADHTADFLVTHKNMARFGQEECAVCHTADDCAECHEGAALFTTESAGNRDIQTPFFPSIGGGTSGLVLTRVHELNFRFTHPMQAEGRTQECVTCHETQNFCQDCHESEGVDVAGKPLWHGEAGGPNWGALAGVVGTGGGRHAELAKRDIESCASCHSTAGDDPTCLLCHTDFDGMRGTNPKTHESGFANRFSEGSDFHSDDSALCFSCHTNTQQAGMGFCGYCHGPDPN